MTVYDAAAWETIADWKQRRLEREARRLLPRTARERLERTGSAAKERFAAMPGAGHFETAFFDALRGVTEFGTRAARASVRRAAVLRAYQKRGHAVDSFEDIRSLGLADIDKVMPRLDLAYIAASTAEGAGAGLAASGGTVLAAGGSVAGAGVGTAPGAGTVVATMAADAAAVLVASHRAVAHVAAYYGYDVDEPQERLYALGVVSGGTAPMGAKASAYVELNKVLQGLARRQTWQQLNSNSVTKIVQQVYKRLGMRLTQRKLAQAVPIVGIVVGAGLNAKMLAGIVDYAQHVYRERHLREKYGLSIDLDERGTPEEQPVDLSEIIDAEIVAEEVSDNGDDRSDNP